MDKKGGPTDPLTSFEDTVKSYFEGKEGSKYIEDPTLYPMYPYLKTFQAQWKAKMANQTTNTENGDDEDKPENGGGATESKQEDSQAQESEANG